MNYCLIVISNDRCAHDKHFASRDTALVGGCASPYWLLLNSCLIPTDS